nr:immunoglobulin light chain junction region [Macaca mulatta]
CMHAVQTPYSF